MRFAKALMPLWNAYSKSGLAQDAAETIGAAGVLAGGQALFTDMTPEQILLSTLLGGGAAFAARPIAANVGGALGRQVDKNSKRIGEKVMTTKIPGLHGNTLRKIKAETSDAEFNEAMNFLASLWAGTPQSVVNAASMGRRGEGAYRVMGEKLSPQVFGNIFGKNTDQNVWKAAQAFNKAKYVQNFKGKTPMEGFLRSLGRIHGDNITQGTIAFATPALLANNAEEVVVV
jgi:hypothetical protein